MRALRKQKAAYARPAGDWLSLNQAAQALGTTRHTVLVRALRGEVVHAFVDDKPVIARQSVEALALRDAQER